MGILAGALIIYINPTRQIQKARDAQRKQDLKQILTGIEFYRNSHGRYPEPNRQMIWSVANYGNSLVDNPLSPTTTYIQNVPKDPSTGRDYFYWADSATNVFSLTSCIENVTDLDALALNSSWPPDWIKSAMNCPGGVNARYYRLINP